MGDMKCAKISDFQGFYFGRPPIMSATDTDFPTPDDDDLKTVSDAGETSLCCMGRLYLSLPFIFNAECLSPSMELEICRLASVDN